MDSEANNEEDQKPTQFRNLQEECVREFITYHWSELAKDEDANAALRKLNNKHPYCDAPVSRYDLDEFEQEVSSRCTEWNYAVPSFEYTGESEGRLEELIKNAHSCFAIEGLLDFQGIRREAFKPEELIKIDPLYTTTLAEYPSDQNSEKNCLRIGKFALRLLHTYAQENIENLMRAMGQGRQTSPPNVVRYGIVTDFPRLASVRAELSKIPTYLLPNHHESFLRMQGITKLDSQFLFFLGPGSYLKEKGPLPTAVVLCNVGPCRVKVRARICQMTSAMVPNVLEKSKIGHQSNIRTKLLSRLRIPYSMIDVKPGQLLFVPALHVYQIRTEGVATLLMWLYAPITAPNLNTISSWGRNAFMGFRTLKVILELMKKGKLDDQLLYGSVKATAACMIVQDKLWAEELQSVGKVLLHQESMDVGYYERQHSPSASFCDGCSAEIFNTALAERSGATYKQLCQGCARTVPYTEERFLAVQSMSYEELSALFDQFITANE